MNNTFSMSVSRVSDKLTEFEKSVYASIRGTRGTADLQHA